MGIFMVSLICKYMGDFIGSFMGSFRDISAAVLQAVSLSMFMNNFKGSLIGNFLQVVLQGFVLVYPCRFQGRFADNLVEVNTVFGQFCWSFFRQFTGGFIGCLTVCF
jgi:hypothetical protein